MYKILITRLRKKFRERLEQKTGWGRNQLMREFDAACMDFLAEILDGEEPKENKKNEQ